MKTARTCSAQRLLWSVLSYPPLVKFTGGWPAAAEADCMCAHTCTRREIVVNISSHSEEAEMSKLFRSPRPGDSGRLVAQLNSDKLASKKSQNSDLNPTPKMFRCPWLSDCREVILFLCHFLLFGSPTLGKAVSCPSLWNLWSLLPSTLRGMPDLLLSGCTLHSPSQEPGKLTGVPLHWESLSLLSASLTLCLMS